LAIEEGFEGCLYLSGSEAWYDLDGIVEDLQSGYSCSTEMCLQVGKEVSGTMATKIRRSEAAKAIVMSLMHVIEPLNEAGVRPDDIAHSLAFILVAYKVNAGWSTEQILQLLEHYITETDKLMPDELPPDDGEYN
tara:strand:+ start:393 stop:797 length:405 start_codon:yes stop_codon:yes gene_type:complete